MLLSQNARLIMYHVSRRAWEYYYFYICVLAKNWNT